MSSLFSFSVWYCLPTVLPWSSTCWWCPPCWSCYATYGGEVHHDFIQGFLLFNYVSLMSFSGFPPDFIVSLWLILSSYLSSPVSSWFLPVNHVLPLFPPWSYCPLMLSPAFLRSILMRIVTILWSVWFDDCLKLPVKLSFYVSLCLICSISFSFYSCDDLMFYLFRWC